MINLLLSLLIILLIAGVLLYVIQNLLPLDPTIRQLAVWLVVIILVLWLLFALLGYTPVVSYPRSRLGP